MISDLMPLFCWQNQVSAASTTSRTLVSSDDRQPQPWISGVVTTLPVCHTFMPNQLRTQPVVSLWCVWEQREEPWLWYCANDESFSSVTAMSQSLRTCSKSEAQHTCTP